MGLNACSRADSSRRYPGADLLSIGHTRPVTRDPMRLAGIPAGRRRAGVVRPARR